MKGEGLNAEKLCTDLCAWVEITDKSNAERVDIYCTMMSG
jgi:hypothetical protein